MNALGILCLLCVVHWFVNAFVHQCVKISFIKIQKYAFTNSFRNHLTITYRFGQLALWQISFRKASIFYHALHFCSFRSYAPNSGRFGFEDSGKTLTCTCKSKGYDQVTEAKTVLDIQCKFDRIISVVIRRLYLVPMVKVRQLKLLRGIRIRI